MLISPAKEKQQSCMFEAQVNGFFMGIDRTFAGEEQRVTCNVQPVRNIIKKKKKKSASDRSVNMYEPIYEMYNIFIFYI